MRLHNGYSSRTLLNLALAYVMARNYDAALSVLSAARELAREGDTQRDRSLAAHCTQCMQSVMPLALSVGMGADNDNGFIQ